MKSAVKKYNNKMTEYKEKKQEELRQTDKV